MRYKLFLVFILVFSVGLVGCSKGQTNIYEPEAVKEIVDTGKTIDITDKNGEELVVTAGDILYLKLGGEAESENQWFVTAPTSSPVIRLVDHKIVGLTDKTVLEGKFVDEWWLKVLEQGNFELKFEYKKFNQEPTSFYALKIVSQ